MFELKIFGARQSAEHMLAGAHKITNMRPTLWLIREDIFRIIKATFTSQGRRYGGSWKQISEEWAVRKETQGLDPRILIARGRLLRSWTVRGDRNMRSHVTNDLISLNSTLPYAEVHQFGSEDLGIPARPYINFHQRDLHRWREMIGSSVLRATK